MEPGQDYLAYEDIDYKIYISRDIGQLCVKVHKKVGFNCVEEKPLGYVIGENILIMRPNG